RAAVTQLLVAAPHLEGAAVVAVPTSPVTFSPRFGGNPSRSDRRHWICQFGAGAFCVVAAGVRHYQRRGHGRIRARARARRFIGATCLGSRSGLCDRRTAAVSPAPLHVYASALSGQTKCSASVSPARDGASPPFRSGIVAKIGRRGHHGL